MHIEYDKPLQPLHTFSVAASTKVFITITDEKTLSALFSANSFPEPFFFLGGGSNVLFAEDFSGTIIQLKTKEISVVEESQEDVLLRVAAGVSWEEFVSYCISHKYYGVENLAGILGWVGSAPVQNIGAYGVEVKEVIEKVEGYDRKRQRFDTYSNEECDFSYRSSLFKKELKNDFFITNVYFRLSKVERWVLHYAGLKEELLRKGGKVTMETVADSVIALRNSKLPDVKKIGSAGSFFKNPVVSVDIFQSLRQRFPDMIHYPCGENEVKLAAGFLIEQCGWKGVRRGDVGIYPHQALVIVNYGEATGKDIVSFYKDVQDSVFGKYGVLLEPEVNIVY